MNPDMTYQLALTTLRRGVIRISEDRYAEVVQARHGISYALAITEEFNLFLENYFEFEQELLTISLRRSVFENSEWSSFQQDIYEVNRCLVNLLSAGRLYIDHASHRLPTDSTFRSTFHASRRHEHSVTLGYRVAEELRNHVQHRGLAIHHLTINASREELNDDSIRAKHRIIPAIDITELRADPEFKPEVILEIDPYGPLVPLTPLIRQYVQALGRVHDTLREAMMPTVAEWEARLTEAIQEASDSFDGNVLGLEVQALNLSGEIVEKRTYSLTPPNDCVRWRRASATQDPLRITTCPGNPN